VHLTICQAMSSTSIFSHLHRQTEIPMNLAGYVIFANPADALEAAGARHEMVTGSGAPHASFGFASPRHRVDADAWSWNPCGEFPGEVSR
jgi:hypothetical protein